MAIKAFRRPPAAGQATVREALVDLAPRADAHGGARIAISEPLPIFQLGLADLAAADPLDRAEFVAWRYLLEGGGLGVAMADVGEGTAGSPLFGSLARNEQAAFLLEAAHLAQFETDRLSQDCDVRILLVPALYASAVWLTADPPLFIPFLDIANPIRSVSDVRVQPKFLSRLVARAGGRRARHGQTPSSMSGP